MVVCNTHLYSHPRGSLVRLVQTSIFLAEIENFVEEMRLKHPGKSVSYILCGDMNALRESGSVELIKNGKLAGNHTDWYSCKWVSMDICLYVCGN